MMTTAITNQINSQPLPQQVRANLFYAISALVIRMLEQAGQASQMRSLQMKDLEERIRSASGTSADLTKTVGNIGLCFAISSFAATAFASYFLGQGAMPMLQCLTGDKMGNAFTAGHQKEQRLAEAISSTSTAKYNNLSSQTGSDSVKNDAKGLFDQAQRACESASRGG